MKVLILGGTNFLGPPLVRRLAGLGHEVAVFHRGRTRAELPAGVAEIRGDRHELRAHASEFRRLGPEVVVDMIPFTEADALGVVDAFRGLARRAVAISSADVYRAYGRFLGMEGGPVEPTPLSEDAPLRSALFPHRAQAWGPEDFLRDYDKIPAERAYLGDPELPATVLRLPMVHGPGDPYRRLSGYLGRMDEGRPAIVLDEVMARWKCPRGYVEDVAAAIARAVLDDRAAGRVYNVADPAAFTEAEWVARIGEAAGWRGEVLTAPAGRIPLPFHCKQDLDTDPSRLVRELGDVERVDGMEALARTIAWERANPPGTARAPGLLDHASEDALLAEIRHR
ncbi:NAD dependent epimerase/dehydratase family protein [Aquisphaera giovannonii]|uniref:NAD dependent epimerase/dehydratase family protein n=1 Tax=Aquisphaera giovannonii TaxID=406548 RepID=A0A5B9VSX6_9BACT|nr:NAD-dependent epimerase/dehydratase family protein [Aquisphaera giovannonii]QEH31596.1 NAD dependent epimerase/dehydratase family protein [Aquisphaera giovannonii]